MNKRKLDSLLWESYYLDTGYRWKAILKLVTLVLLLLEFVAGVIIAKRSEQFRTILKNYLFIVILSIFMFIACIYISL